MTVASGCHRLQQTGTISGKEEKKKKKNDSDCDFFLCFSGWFVSVV